MYVNVYRTHWALFFITLISSGFLLYMVAAETNKSEEDKLLSSNSEISVIKEILNNNLAHNLADKDLLSSKKKLLSNNTKTNNLQSPDVAVETPIDASKTKTLENITPPQNVILSNGDSINLDSTTINNAAEGTHPNHSQIEQTTDDKKQSISQLNNVPSVSISEMSAKELTAKVNLNISEALLVESNDKTNTTINNTSASAIEYNNRDNNLVEDNAKSAIENAQRVPVQNLPTTTSTTIPTNNIKPQVATNDNNNINNLNNDSINKIIITNNNASTNYSGKHNEMQQVNVSNDEVPIPVFSEWTQQQMEAAEKEALEKEVITNTSTQRKNNTNGNGKSSTLKIRAKNYASPDCGAKIIASNSDASNTDAVLSSLKDEYMLNPCGSRIWFVVELCEAIQAQRIELANFELFSSSPKNFTASISSRFPTRDWSSVGSFRAEDKRTVQSFQLYPNLFGKFLRVDIQSHYSEEHFCPVSLFRVYGTSEFEAFETESHVDEEDDDDDYEEDSLLDQVYTKDDGSNNLFKSASDAVFSIVKKAAEVLVKSSNPKNRTNVTKERIVICQTPIVGLYNCTMCSSILVERTNFLLSCDMMHLERLLNVQSIRNYLWHTSYCVKYVNNTITPTPKSELKLTETESSIPRNYYISLLPTEHLVALCHILKFHELNIIKKYRRQNNVVMNGKDGNENISINSQIRSHVYHQSSVNIETTPEELSRISGNENLKNNMDSNGSPSAQLRTPLTDENAFETIQINKLLYPLSSTAELTDVNVLNVPTSPSSNSEVLKKNGYHQNSEENVISNGKDSDILSDGSKRNSDLQFSQSLRNLNEELSNRTNSTINALNTPDSTNSVSAGDSKSEEDTNSWESIENLINPSNVASSNIPIQTTGRGSTTHSNSQIVHQKSNNQPQSESIFQRLSNRIKALELNMSLSGQYLEELSRRYKKQVEDLQQHLIQQMQAMRLLESEHQHHQEMEKQYILQSAQLKAELDDLTLQIRACIVIVIIAGTFMLLVFFGALLLCRSLRRDNKELLAHYSNINKSNNLESNQLKNSSLLDRIPRSKSFEDIRMLSTKNTGRKDNLSSNKLEQKRRPSEEVSLILKKSDYNNMGESCYVTTTTPRQRKISVFYGSNYDICSKLSNKKSSNDKRLKQKHSWHHFDPATIPGSSINDYSKDNPWDNSRYSKLCYKLPLNNGGIPNGIKSRRKTELHNNNVQRQVSVPPKLPSYQKVDNNPDSSIHYKMPINYEGNLRLDEDDIDNFIPNTDLAYNEFMPEGPSGYQCNISINNHLKPKNALLPPENGVGNKKKRRRLSSPAFFKSHFTKSIKGKLSATIKPKSGHASTSWEWYRLKKSSSAMPPSSPVTTINALSLSSNASMDSSLSEINFPTNSTQNSFRILEEAILSSQINNAASGQSSCGNDSSYEHSYCEQTNNNNSKKVICNGDDNGLIIPAISNGGISTASSNSNRSINSNYNTNSLSNSSLNGNLSENPRKKSNSFQRLFRKIF